MICRGREVSRPYHAKSFGHGNSFPMTQSAQSLRQMRSISHCSKAVFYVFVFDYIDDSTTMYNLSPTKYPQRGFHSYNQYGMRW